IQNTAQQPALTFLQDDYNVVVVDWSAGAREFNYLQSVANTRVVGSHVAQLLIVLKRLLDIDLHTVHIIGHSLGAHAAGYAGEHVDGIGRITGLDPAGPAFEGTDQAVRLDPDDAIFVDVIHTDAEHILSGGFGIKQPVGAVDFYPNGGKDQPGCPTTYFAQIKWLFSGNFQLINNFICSHMRVLEFFTESINSACQFKASLCPHIDATSWMQCQDCQNGACAKMGFHVDPTSKPGSYFLLTNPSSPYCY
ncbi:pancreatic triacylglycerol lipase-like, partial [Dreissena polymorpha]|uniref:pancreatic triacylglycerol lipase-like n=1 Tax=Dreissena polymorpha TaxID=45954 RepID=UPI002263F304